MRRRQNLPAQASSERYIQASPDSSRKPAPLSRPSTFTRYGMTSFKVANSVHGGLSTNMPLVCRPKPSGDGELIDSVTLIQLLAPRRLRRSENCLDSIRCSTGYQTA